MTTGNSLYDTLLLIVAAALGWLAEYLRTRAGRKPDDPQPTPPVAATFVGDAGKPRKVSLTGWLALLLTALAPVLNGLIAKALDALAKRLGREPTPAEALDAAEQVAIDYLAEQKARRRGLFGGDAERN